MGIVYSTLAIKQHVVLDVLAGMLLGGLTGVAFTWAADMAAAKPTLTERGKSRTRL